MVSGTCTGVFRRGEFHGTWETLLEKYLTVSFPYSNDDYSHVFGGETAKCVC